VDKGLITFFIEATRLTPKPDGSFELSLQLRPQRSPTAKGTKQVDTAPSRDEAPSAGEGSNHAA
jgi:hypothetical protein